MGTTQNLVILLCGLLQALHYSAATTCQTQFLCQPCNSCCSQKQLGCGSDAGSVNMTAIEEMIDRKIKEGLSKCQLCSNVSNKDEVIPQSCYNIPLDSAKSRNETGGVFDIDIPSVGKTEVYCDVTTDGGNWIVFQRRMDGSVDFYRDWNDYVNGFGKVEGEFWLGLEAIHQLTKKAPFELRIDMITKEGKKYFAKYNSFQVGTGSDNYRLNVGGYSGDATDSFANPLNQAAILNGMQFSTRDKDNDKNGQNCAGTVKGGWWFNNCLHSHLNGLYESLQRWNGVFWLYQTGLKSMHMKFTEMKIRQKQ